MGEHEGRPSPDVDALRQRVSELERQNLRLRQRTEQVFGADDPDFDPRTFQRVLSRYMMMLSLPMGVLFPLLAVAVVFGTGVLRQRIPVGPTVLFDFAGMQSGMPGLGLGIIAFGGAALGVIAVGGFAVGLIAIGGGAIGVVAIGGGAVGLIAFGGGAVGWIAVGGGAAGRYALGGQGAGKYVFSLKRRDKEAVAFFCRYLPALKKAITGPMPVVPVDTAGFR